MKPNHDFAVTSQFLGIIRTMFLFPAEMTCGSLLPLEEFTATSKGQDDLMLSPKKGETGKCNIVVLLRDQVDACR